MFAIVVNSITMAVEEWLRNCQEGNLEARTTASMTRWMNPRAGG